MTETNDLYCPLFSIRIEYKDQIQALLWILESALSERSGTATKEFRDSSESFEDTNHCAKVCNYKSNGMVVNTAEPR